MPLILVGVIGGTLIATALKALFDIGSTVAQNKYNSPVAMLRRVRKAGLPMSYMHQGKVATQTQSPQLNIDPHLGTVAKQDAALTKLKKEDLGLDIQAKGLMSGIKNEDGTELNNRAAQQRAKSFIDNYEGELKKLEFQVEKEAFAEGITMQAKREALAKAAQQVKNLLAQAGLMEQLKKIRGFEEKLNDSLTQDLDSLPDWISSLLKIILIATKRR